MTQQVDIANKIKMDNFLNAGLIYKIILCLTEPNK